MIHHGDSLEVMATFEPESIDAIVTDPPYGLEFMGKAWDKLDRHGPASFENMGVPRYDSIPSTPPPPVQRAVEAVQNAVVEPAIQWIGTVAVPVRKSDRPPPGTEN